MSKNSILYKNFQVWIFICQILGFFSYCNNGRQFRQNRYHLLDTFRCIFLYLGNELYFSGFKSKYNYFGWILVAVDFIFASMWIVLFIQNNSRLISVFKSFDTFDDTFKKITKMNFKQKPCFTNKIVILVSFLFITDYFSMFYCVLHLRGTIAYSFVTAFSRALQRSVMALFLTGYLYLLHSVQIRFQMLQELWTSKVEFQIDNIFKHIQIIRNMNDIKSLNNHLTDVLESMNLCFGSRLVIIFGQAFYFILLYFYMICTGLPVVICLLPFYLSVIFFLTLRAQSLYNAMNIVPRMLKLQSTKASERFLAQWYGFIQEQRSRPVHVNASGFFTVDQKLLGSLTMAIASYLVAIFQLAPLMDNIGKKTVISLI